MPTINDILIQLETVLEQRKQTSPNHSYTARLFANAPDAILKKIGEETTEVIIASKSGERDDIIHEVTDLLFHLIVLLKYHHVEVSDIYNELEKRFGLSGLKEKANRK